MRSIDKRIYLIFMTAVTISGFIMICTLGQSIHRQKLAAKISVSDTVPSEPLCTVRENNRRIGVFRGDSKVPYRLIDYDVKLLSDYDREQLKKGVPIETERELQRFIEDIAT